MLGLLLQYPFLPIKHQLHLRNQFTRGKPHTYRSCILEMRVRHGITKVFDGFFTSRPMLNAVPAALLMTLYDVCTRRYTEFLHPKLQMVHAEVDQPLFSVSGASYASYLPAYEFARKCGMQLRRSEGGGVEATPVAELTLKHPQLHPPMQNAHMPRFTLCAPFFCCYSWSLLVHFTCRCLLIFFFCVYPFFLSGVVR
ncbi:solute carrier family 25 (mitochondrial adenine nucleotide translocator), member 4/5/6/31 [Trypanosoma rangeli]|uniref:Solute carrier family 25 (Mitochondrial adenine nucleotide translocator), member 4/5/6/31 n=1 Tax=Trypanosoma rangeli TaxID=5698 RepID=A0A422N144_TRYRA|nr:solute carrier family 25 (mitochondrial adenine nucleotide translocator), member 4/5/6/31 [Trypanosoma rangeli]RNE99173.1 solute carrier family 25 (mitochondrial adenine nucleotide translocator), member 4/5/6/31 [Trypanosoma rangeli]|eukprot:RNE99173.1 solute carrier family 25 (mitochondrial adenine nucleotide translocator), member 4/5/6/31 [Trypanosoma rangeli]